MRTALLLLIVALVGCEGPEGPMGPQGEQGPIGLGTVGPQGPAGPQGASDPQGAAESGQALNWADVLEETGINEGIYAIGYEVLGTNFLIGTGFSAHFTDVIWTNAHVAQGLSEAVTTLAFLGIESTPFVAKSGTTIGGSHTYELSTFLTHPSYDGTTLSPDIAVLVISEQFTLVPQFLPREFANDLRVGQPIATMGFPGEIAALNTTVPIASFKDGTISALRVRSETTSHFRDWPAGISCSV